eukprot:CAMPEP_0172329164 /NCGR_PEP_ID=MMETSP1058-20130122/60737_1 /TAXON_ID=83371 /ORGANISM="Detonula confervacea, Strain CCMP 353" /LENGTH=504 /DNA_ID=CAMNT_0013046321 /DNA_START=99 /DNA_END=1610 /DNA_ORIENTATION=+
MISTTALTYFLAAAGFTLLAKPTYAQQRLRSLSIEETGDLGFAVGEPMSFATASSTGGKEELPELMAHGYGSKSSKSAKSNSSTNSDVSTKSEGTAKSAKAESADPPPWDEPETKSSKSAKSNSSTNSDVSTKSEGTAKSAKAESADPPPWDEPETKSSKSAKSNSSTKTAKPAGELETDWDGYWGGWGESENPLKSKSSKSWDCGWSDDDDGWNGHDSWNSHGGAQLADILLSVIHQFFDLKSAHGKSGKSKSDKSLAYIVEEAEHKLYELMFLLTQHEDTIASMAETVGPSLGPIISLLKDAITDGKSGDLSEIVAAILGSAAAGQGVGIPVESEVPEIVAAGFDSAAAGAQGIEIPADAAAVAAALGSVAAGTQDVDIPTESEVLEIVAAGFDSAAAGAQGIEIPADAAAVAATLGSVAAGTQDVDIPTESEVLEIVATVLDSAAAGAQGADVPTYVNAAVAAAAALIQDIGVPDNGVAAALEGAEAAIGGIPADFDFALD